MKKLTKPVFDNKRLKTIIEKLENDPIEYYIGIDSYSDDGVSSYCLGYRQGNIFRVLLAKTERNPYIFKEEVDNLTKYFNAEQIIEHGKRKNS